MLFMSYVWSDNANIGRWGFGYVADDFAPPQTEDELIKVRQAIVDARFPGQNVTITPISWKVM